MIDFRYHLVSLVAVFMALAVGIVLGAGPLGQEISSTLEAQVRELREERNGLRAQLDQAEARDELKNQVVQIVTPTVASNQLSGRRVGVITLPGADRNIVGQLQDRIGAAGGQVVLTARLDDSWTDPDSAATRHEIAAELAPSLSLPQPREGAEPTTETVLAAALTGHDTVVGSGAWRTAADRLEEVGFLETNWADNQDATAQAPDSLVIIAGDLTTQQVEEDAGGDPELQQSLDLVAAFGALGAPTLVAGYGTESFADPVQSAESPVIRGVRAESAIAQTVSSVDNVERAAGQLSTVLGLRWSIEGQPGHWGLGTDAVDPAPAVPEPLPEETEPLVPAPTLPAEPTDPDQTVPDEQTGPLSPSPPADDGAVDGVLPTPGTAPAPDTAPTAGTPTP